VAEQVVEFARMRRLYESRRNGLTPQEISEAAPAQCA